MAKTFAEKRFFKWEEDEIAVSLRNHSGSYGGVRSVSYKLYSQTVGSLCATDYKWVQQQQVEQDKLVIQIETDTDFSL